MRNQVQTEKQQNREAGCEKHTGMKGYIALILLLELAFFAKRYDGIAVSVVSDPAGFAIMVLCAGAVTLGGIYCVNRIDGGPDGMRRESAAYLNALFLITALPTFFAILYGGSVRTVWSTALMLAAFIMLLLLERRHRQTEELVDNVGAALRRIGPVSLLLLGLLLLLLI